MTDEEDTREQGVELGDLAGALERHDYPTTNEELVADLGDRELDLPEGKTTLRETLGPQSDTTYESPEEVEQAILNMVGQDAVGREHYSDRGSTTGNMSEDESF
jgi:hypothetical protein